MTFSIVTVTLNSAHTLGDTLASVARQQGVNVEHIVKDGGSTDGTVELARSHRSRPKIVEKQDAGIYDAMNQGFQASTGEFISFLNSDDFLTDDLALAKVRTAFQETKADIVYGNIEILNSEGKVARRWRSGELKNGKLAGKQLPHPAFFVRRAALEQLDLPFDPRYKISADFKQQLLLINHLGLSSSYIDETLVCMRSGGTSTANIGAYIRGWRECARAYREVTHRPGIFFVAAKVIRKIKQFFPAGEHEPEKQAQG